MEGKSKPVDMNTISGEQNLMVALRIRPLTDDEMLQGASNVAHKLGSNLVVLMDPLEDPDDVLRANRSRERQFIFDFAFGGGATQDKIYQRTTKFLIENVVRGFNATVFAYGATGAGKTYTMLGTDDNPGIMVRALNDLFLAMENNKRDMTYSVSMSYLEVYNEMIRDLLNPASGYLELREDHRGNMQVAGLSEITTLSTQEVMELLKKGNQVRTQEPTAANPTSSRSHAVLQVSVRQRDRAKRLVDEVRLGRLFLIDLAGSERASNTQNRGKRMVEGAHINRSLLALGNCINALSDKTSNKYINYRDSKLTRILKDALGGNCKTVMIAHISPASIHFEESRNTLMYADRAKHIRTKVRRNVLDVSYHIAQYTSIIHELRDEITRLRNKLNDPSAHKPVHSFIRKSTAGKPLVSNIQSVQNEVLGPARRDELNKLKDQLMSVFKDQMDMRKALLELNNTAMEINLDMARHQLLINEWETDRCRLRRKHTQLGNDNRSRDLEKEQDLQGSELYPEPSEVSTARSDLKVLMVEKEKTQTLKVDLKRELEATRLKAKKLEEVMPQMVSRQDEREMLGLLCRVHELEIANAEMESLVLLREHELRRKDLIVLQSKQRRLISHEIIKQQKQLIDDHDIPYPKDLQEMMASYLVENEDLFISPESSLINVGNPYKTTSVSDIHQRATLVARSPHPTSQQQANNPEEMFDNDVELVKKSKHSSINIDSCNGMDGDQVFSRSGKHRYNKLDEHVQPERKQAKHLTSINVAGNRAQSRDVDKESLCTLSRQSASPEIVEHCSDTSLNVTDSTSTSHVATTNKNPPHRDVIATNTRNIAALAMTRRSRLPSTTTSNYYDVDVDEQHRRYNETTTLSVASHTPSLQRLDVDRYEAMDDDVTSSASVSARLSANNKYQPSFHDERINQQLHRGAGGRRHGDVKPQLRPFIAPNKRQATREIRPSLHQRPTHQRPRPHKDDLRTLDMAPTPPSTVYQSGAERGRGHALQKHYRGPASESSLSSNDTNKKTTSLVGGVAPAPSSMTNTRPTPAPLSITQSTRPRIDFRVTGHKVG